MESIIDYLALQVASSPVPKKAPKVEKVASIEEIKKAEEVLRFPLPELIKQILQRIGNGGRVLGPGFGLLGLNGLSGNLSDSNMVNESLEFRSIPCFNDWPSILVLCSWGCSSYSCADCSDSDIPIYRFDGDFLIESFNNEEPSDQLWGLESDSLEDWFIEGINIWGKGIE